MISLTPHASQFPIDIEEHEYQTLIQKKQERNGQRLSIDQKMLLVLVISLKTVNLCLKTQALLVVMRFITYRKIQISIQMFQQLLIPLRPQKQESLLLRLIDKKVKLKKLIMV